MSGGPMPRRPRAGDDAGIRWVDEFRDPRLSRAVVAKLRPLAAELAERKGGPLQVMEVCGGHTHTLFRFGIPQLVADHVQFVHGPGCPVCVLPRDVIAQCVAWAQRPEVVLTTFGDAIRVPGHGLSLQQARAHGASVEVVYSPLDALAIARDHPDREVVFLALGFDTTMPSTALTVLQAEREGITNFSLYAVHIGIVPTLHKVLDDSGTWLDGLIGPGHVSMVIGSDPYGFVAAEHHLPFVIAGFEPLDLLQSLHMVLRQVAAGEARVENQYGRTVRPAGNPAALHAIHTVFEPVRRPFWQGLGAGAEVGVGLREEYRRFDAEARLPPLAVVDDAPGVPVQCDEVIMGRLSPPQCPHFGADCTPDSPLGALMVSSEGACAAWAQLVGSTHGR